jgi:hypothetical protein
MDRQIDQAAGSVELHIWREESGAWCCDVLTPAGSHTVRLDDQAALSAYIAGHIDMFVEEFELLSQAAGVNGCPCRRSPSPGARRPCAV